VQDDAATIMAFSSRRSAASKTSLRRQSSSSHAGDSLDGDGDTVFYSVADASNNDAAFGVVNESSPVIWTAVDSLSLDDVLQLASSNKHDDDDGPVMASTNRRTSSKRSVSASTFRTGQSMYYSVREEEESENSSQRQERQRDRPLLLASSSLSLLPASSPSSSNPLDHLLHHLNPLQVIQHMWMGSMHLLGSAISNVFFHGDGGSSSHHHDNHFTEEGRRRNHQESSNHQNNQVLSKSDAIPMWMKRWEQDIMIPQQQQPSRHQREDPPAAHHFTNDGDNDWTRAHSHHYHPVPHQIVTPTGRYHSAVDTSFLTFDEYFDEHDDETSDDNDDDRESSSVIVWGDPAEQYSVSPETIHEEEDNDETHWEPIDWSKQEFRNSSPLPFAVCIGAATATTTTREDDRDDTFLTFD
jgi:hypothetical protein